MNVAYVTDSLAVAAMVLASASISNQDYVPEQWHTFLLTVFIMILHAIISSMPTRWIANFNSVGSSINMVYVTLGQSLGVHLS